MKGLFVKDIELMKQQKQFFILVVAVSYTHLRAHETS